MACQTADKKSSTLKDSVQGDTITHDIVGTPSTETGVDETGAIFLKQSVSAVLMEIELAKIAQKNAQQATVKTFATQIQTDYTKLSSMLETFAREQKVITSHDFPAEIREHLNEVKNLKGQAFDRHYIHMVNEDHQKIIALFKKGAETRNTKLKSWIEENQSLIESNLKKAGEIEAAIQ